MPSYEKAYMHIHTYTHLFTHYRQFGDASQNATHVSGLKLENAKEIPKAQREHANSTHMAAVEIEPSAPEKRGFLTAKLLSPLAFIFSVFLSV